MGGVSNNSPAGSPIAGGALGSFSTIQNLIKPFIGVGILAMPATWAKGGLIASSILLILLCATATWCILRLVECTDTIMRCEADHNRRVRLALEKQQQRVQGSMFSSVVSPEDVAEATPFFPPPTAPEGDLPPVSAAAYRPPTFPADPDAEPSVEDWQSITVPSFTEVGRAAFGYWGGVLVDFSVIVTQFGGCVAYLIFVSSNLADLTSLSQRAWIAIQAVPLALLCIVRRTDVFAPVSTLANLAYLYTVTMLFFDGADDCCLPAKDLNLMTLSQLPTVFGICSFSLEGIALIIPVKRRMAQPQKFVPLMIIAGACVGGLYLVMAVSGYLFFGVDVASPVIKSLHSGWHADSVKIGLSLSIFFTYVLMVFPASEFFDTVIDAAMDVDVPARLKDANTARAQSRRAAEDAGIVSGSVNGGPPPEAPLTEDDVHLLFPSLHRKRWWYQTAARIGFVVATSGTAAIFPNFELILMLFGSFTLSLLAYILPPIFWMRVHAASHLYGRDWFPYTRSGQPLPGGPRSNDDNDDDDGDSATAGRRTPRGELSGASGSESSASASAAAAADSARRARVALLSDSDDSEASGRRKGRARGGRVTSPGAAQGAGAATGEGSLASLGEGAEDDADGAVGAEGPWAKRPLGARVAVYALPATVAVVGIMASCVGLTEAIINIKNEL